MWMMEHHAAAIRLCSLTVLVMALPPLTAAAQSATNSTTPPTAAVAPPQPTTAPPPTTTTAKAPTTPAVPPPKTSAATPPAPAAVPPTVSAARPSKATPPTAATQPPKANASPTAPPTATPPATSVSPSAPPPKKALSPAKLAPQPTKASAPSAPAPASPPPESTPPVTAPAGALAPSDLDPGQFEALISLKVNFTHSDPCSTPKDILLCDTGSTPHHVISLSLQNCPTSAHLSTAALYNLSSIKQLEFLSCPMTPVHVPSGLVGNLTTLIVSQSLGKTGINEKADKLPGTWLAQLTNLVDLSVTDVEVDASSLYVITGNLNSVKQLTLARINVGGKLPHNSWPPDVEFIDVSGNSIVGTIPTEMGKLGQLTHVDLSDNQLSGVIPNIFGQLNNLQYIDMSGNQLSGPIPGSVSLLHNCSRLDLHANRLNGSIPANISNMKTLRYLDLSDNALTGLIPFNTKFLNQLTTFKISGNTGLCYNHTTLKSKFLTSIPNCPSLAAEVFAPSPGPTPAHVSSSAGGSGHLSKGAVAGISITVILVAAIMFFVIRKWWKNRDDSDQFVNLRRHH